MPRPRGKCAFQWLALIYEPRGKKCPKMKNLMTSGRRNAQTHEDAVHVNMLVCKFMNNGASILLRWSSGIDVCVCMSVCM